MRYRDIVHRQDGSLWPGASNKRNCTGMRRRTMQRRLSRILLLAVNEIICGTQDGLSSGRTTQSNPPMLLGKYDRMMIWSNFPAILPYFQPEMSCIEIFLIAPEIRVPNRAWFCYTLVLCGTKCSQKRPKQERWQSGRLYLTRNQAMGRPIRGFESLPLRQCSSIHAGLKG